jgi:predicted NBD/HSP70 family sugar kinase
MQINNYVQKNANISMITQVLWKTPGISRVEIARRLNLYRSTVSNIINVLIEHGVVLEEQKGAAAMSGGRKPIHLTLNRRFGCVLGIELRPSGYSCVLVDMAGTLVHTLSGLLPDAPFDTMLDILLFEMYREVKKYGLPLLAVCVALPGIIDSKHEEIIESPPFGMKNQRFKQAFFRRYNIPLFIENNANCLAWLELSKNGNAGRKNFMCVSLEAYEKNRRLEDWNKMDVGIGLAIEGSVFSGDKHRAGEFIAPPWKGGPAGRPGPLVKGRRHTASGEAAFRELTAELFFNLINVVSVLNPGTIFLYGGLTTRASLVKEIIRERVPHFNLLLRRISCDLVFTGNSDLAAATGAAMMYFLNLFSLSGNRTGKFNFIADWDAVFARSSGVDGVKGRIDPRAGLSPVSSR